MTFRMPPFVWLLGYGLGELRVWRIDRLTRVWISEYSEEMKRRTRVIILLSGTRSAIGLTAVVPIETCDESKAAVSSGAQCWTLIT